jgi:deoxyribonuclease-2
MNLSALDENGKAVDWWFAYKAPKLTTDATTSTTTGYEYVYYDPNVGKVAKSPNLLTDGQGAHDRTLKSVFGKPDATTGWILYNDEMPAEAKVADSASYGHTKGVIMFDTASKTAIWLLHSWPKYVDPTIDYADPGQTGTPTPKYGQTYLCLSLDLATASAIAKQMATHQSPQVYTPRVPASLAKTDPLYVLTQTLNPSAAGASDVLDCKTRGGLAFKVIAKNRNWGKLGGKAQDFWNDLVGPTLKSDIDVESWIRGDIPSTLDNDGIHKTFDVKFIDFSPLGVPWTWPETDDHAKWGITVDSDWVCVGDINRMISQEKRGGGTIAFQDEKLWGALSKTDLLVAPPGHSRVDAQQLIKATHATTHPSPHKAAAPKPAAKPAKAKPVAKKAGAPKPAPKGGKGKGR